MVNGVSRSRTRRSCMVRRFAPEFVKRWNRFRAVVRASRQTINFMLSARCDVTAPQGHDRTVGRPVRSDRRLHLESAGRESCQAMDGQHRCRETGHEQWLATRGHFGQGLRRLPYVCPSRDWRAALLRCDRRGRTCPSGGGTIRACARHPRQNRLSTWGRTTSASLRRRRNAPPSCAISLEVLRVPAGSLTWRAGGRPISRAA
ncbi:hypothetical protein R69919_02295 [Paraburkholderia gardini]|nr:hypothetical protein R69919_02295 [Paraburkholderia gardini]